jgi:2-oxoglutarate dehydrogenase E2 component (dihydrolipoamide succinyltransferase)
MQIEIKVPSPGESISEVEIAKWFVSEGEMVQKGQEIAEIESDKATLPLIASEGGQIHILKSAGTAVPVGEVVCTIDSSKKTEGKPVLAAKNSQAKVTEEKTVSKESTDPKKETKPVVQNVDNKEEFSSVKVTPVAQKMMDDNNLSVEDIIQGLKKLSSREVNAVLQSAAKGSSVHKTSEREISRKEERSRMSVLRRKISQRLVAVKNETAMLTTFNEVDMTSVMEIRKKYQEAFVKKHGIKLGFMSFFTKAVSEALLLYPMVNSRLEGEEIITPSFTDIGIAVQTEKGLMVPVLRNAEALSLAGIETKISELAGKARTNKISIEEMTGGTFTITNGGIYGSMMSTPILNPPQSAILGMHNIIERPIALNGQVVIRPMMYIALSYDHRIIDGKDSVSFLLKVRNYIEDPGSLLFGGDDPLSLLLNI